jgi:hypothetical protein
VQQDAVPAAPFLFSAQEFIAADLRIIGPLIERASCNEAHSLEPIDCGARVV